MFYPVSQPGRRVRHALLTSFGWVWVVLKGHLGGDWVGFWYGAYLILLVYSNLNGFLLG